MKLHLSQPPLLLSVLACWYMPVVHACLCLSVLVCACLHCRRGEAVTSAVAESCSGNAPSSAMILPRDLQTKHTA